MNRALVFIALLLVISPAFAHDAWISKGGLKNPAGEWCCGEGDCGVLVSGRPVALPGGWHVVATFRVTLANGTSFDVRVDEVVPYSETQPSPDGMFWRCHRPDKTRRCFFAPPPNS